jgi:hypothetical protein
MIEVIGQCNLHFYPCINEKLQTKYLKTSVGIFVLAQKVMEFLSEELTVHMVMCYD